MKQALFRALFGLFLGWLSASFGQPAGAATEWVVQSWQTRDGLPQNTVMALWQTRDGFLWVGTSGGLGRFDGVKFRVFGLVDGLGSVQITSLCEDARGVLWVGTAGGGLSRWENGRFYTMEAAEGFRAATVQALAADSEGTVWVGTEQGLVRWHDGKFQTMGSNEGLPAGQVRALLMDSRGTLWVSVLMEGIYWFKGGKFMRAAGMSQGADAYCLFEDNEGAVWGGMSNGRLWQWHNTVWTWWGRTNGLPANNIQALAGNQSSPLIVGARHSGVYLLREGRFQRLITGTRLDNETVQQVLVDRAGAHWVGTVDGGLHRLSPRVLKNWGEAEGLTEPIVTSVAQDAAGRLWVGTQNDGIHQLENGRFTRLSDPKVSINFPFIYTLATTADGSLWAAGEQCLFRFRAGRKTEAYLNPPVRGEAIRAMCADGATLWLGTYYSTLLCFDTNGLHVVATNGTFEGDIRCMVRGRAGELWIGTSRGLHRWAEGRTQQRWTKADGLLTGSIRALHRDADGTLWIGTLGGGLARLREGRLVNLTTREGLADDVISQILADDQGYLWLGGNHGLMRLRRREVEEFATGKTLAVYPEIFGQHDGMVSEQCKGGHSPAALKTEDGRLLFSTMGGVVEIDPRRLPSPVGFIPQVVIESLIVDDQRQELASELVLRPGARALEIHYTAPCLVGGEWVRFRTRLDGFDHDWVSAGTRRVIYRGLRPGRYLFHVAASNARGEWSDKVATLAITVQPRFWETYWFGGMVLSLSGGAAGLWYRRRIRRLDERRRAQAEFTRQLIQAQEAERSRLARELHDDITQRLARLAIDTSRVERGGGAAPAVEMMSEVREGLVRLSEDVHALSYRLHPSLLDDLGLVAALKVEGERFGQQEGLACKVRVRRVPGMIPRETALGLFRVAQEALRNVARHARATTVELTLWGRHDGLHLAVRDNGVGFDPAAKRKRVSIGLAGMRERMHLLGGELDIDSTPGHGTTILAWAPLKGELAS